MTPVHSGRSRRTAESPAGGEAEPCAVAAHGEDRRAKTVFILFFPGKRMPGNQSTLCLWDKNDQQMFCAVQLLSVT